MTRVIIITFAMLGWSFYVISGGPDFEPRGMRAEQPRQVAFVTEPEPARGPVAEQLVARAALQPALPAIPIVEIIPDAAPATDEEETRALLAQIATGLNLDTSFVTEQGTTLTLASLEQGAAALQQVTPDAVTDASEAPPLLEPERDIREVSGTRVNMRDGPGTIYPIIGKATIGQQVEVFGESGTGWLRLRVLNTQQVGWISASLIRKTRN